MHYLFAWRQQRATDCQIAMQLLCRLQLRNEIVSLGIGHQKKRGIQRSLDQLSVKLELFSIRLHHPHDCNYRNYQPDNKQNLHNTHVKSPLVKVKLFYKKIVHLLLLCVRKSGIMAKIVAINKTISKA